MEKIFKYIEYGIDIRRTADAKYEVFTIPTQRFKIDSLEELTPERFEKAIKDFEEREKMQAEIFRVSGLGI
jgi:hypothetical protein